MEKKYDYIVVGSGFGGSVSTLRLSEKGYKVCVIEQGKRYTEVDYPKTNWEIKKYLWLPLLRCFGIQKLTFFKKVLILSGVGVGGGSLVYANTLFEPKSRFFDNGNWAKIKDWKATLAPYYLVAKKMLGAVPSPFSGIEDTTLLSLAKDMQREHTYHTVEVGVNFEERQNFDPYFSGLGPKRNPCVRCAGCMIGCQHNAKNTLDKNYLYLAETYFGAEIIPETKVVKINYTENQYFVTTVSATNWLVSNTQTYIAKGLVISGGVLGTLELLLNQKYKFKTLERLSDTLGQNLRTNSESICGIVSKDIKLNNNIAITSVFRPDDDTHIEVCKYPSGSSLMLRLAVPAVGPGVGIVRLIKLLGTIVLHPLNFLKPIFNKKIADHTVIFLVMQTLDNAFAMRLRGKWWKSMQIEDDVNTTPVPAYIEVGQNAMHQYAKKVNGTSQNAITEIAFNMATTAHIMGGVPLGETEQEGVVNAAFEVFNYPNFYILDGSILQFNPGVNPSLTITAIAEYAMAQVPIREGHIGKTLEMLMEEAAM